LIRGHTWIDPKMYVRNRSGDWTVRAFASSECVSTWRRDGAQLLLISSVFWTDQVLFTVPTDGIVDQSILVYSGDGLESVQLTSLALPEWDQIARDAAK
jgi:hypothetical protein